MPHRNSRPQQQQQLQQFAGAPVLDSSVGFEESEFADSHHLLPAGAARFSRKLANEHLRTWN
jgi:hypothetical protein